MNHIAFKLKRRLNWYRGRFQVNNRVVGRVVELLGDRVRMDGLTYSVSAPQITRGHKSTLAFGLHEMEERALVRRWLPADVPVVEFGGGLGVVSCLTNKRLSHPKDHVVVEANPGMIAALERNRDINGCSFTVMNKALAYGVDYIDLDMGREFVGSSIKTDGGQSIRRVPTTTLSEIITGNAFEYVGIVCDIEGAEADLINNELPILGDRVRFLMAEMHPKILGSDTVDRLHSSLKRIGLLLKDTIGDCVFYSRS